MQAVSQTDCAEKYQYENSERVCIRAFGSKWRRKIDIDENIVRDDAGRCRGSIFWRKNMESWLDEIALKDLLLPLYVIDKSKEVAANPNFILSKQDILDFEAEYGQITEGAFVAFRSDWSKLWPDQDAMRNLDENGVQQSPGWSREALEFLIYERKVKAVGHETFDTDAGIPAAEHGLVNEYYLLEQNIYQVEVLNQLDQVPAVGALISIAFPHWDKATGSPVRAVAILP